MAAGAGTATGTGSATGFVDPWKGLQHPCMYRQQPAFKSRLGSLDITVDGVGEVVAAIHANSIQKEFPVNLTSFDFGRSVVSCTLMMGFATDTRPCCCVASSDSHDKYQILHIGIGH